MVTISRPEQRQSITERAAVGRRGDTILLATLALSALAALAIAGQYGGMSLAIACCAVTLAVAGAMFGLARGSVACRLALTLANASLVALQIDLGRGTIEFHFGVFMLLSVLLVYRDVRPILLGAGFFAVHHVLFDRLQGAGFAVWCTPQADFLKVLMHAGYVVVQTAAEVAIVLSMTRMSRAGEELTALLAAMHQGGRLSLDVSALQFRSDEARAMQASLLDIHGLIGRLRGSTRGVADASRDIAAGNLDLSARTEQSGAWLQETAASVACLNQGIGEAATVSRSSTQLIAATSDAAARGGLLASDAAAAMTRIQASTSRIGDIIATVDGIAFQTNILALNAAVEAARAGTHGRGFAVVAGEVRTLATRSAAAAREVKSLVAASLETVAHGTSLVNEAGTVMVDVVDRVRDAAQLSARLTEITGTQAASANQVAGAVAKLDEMVQRNAALVEQTAAASTALGQETGQLHATLASFGA